MKWILYLLVSFLGLAVSPANAGLKFESTESNHESPSGGTIQSVFRFTNTGANGVRITKIETSCGCLRAVADKRSYLPGETGAIETEFKVPQGSAGQKKTLTVWTDLRSEPATLLTVSVKFPPLLEIQPKMISWAVGEALTPKRISFKVLRPEAIRILEVLPSKPVVTATIHTIVEGRHYEVELTPVSTAEPLLGSLRMDTDCEISGQKRQLSFFRIDRRKSP